MTLEEEVRQQFHEAIARTPLMLRVTTGEITNLDQISTDEQIHALQLQVIELARITERLAREIDQLRTT
jgi:hypothetical protein